MLQFCTSCHDIIKLMEPCFWREEDKKRIQQALSVRRHDIPYYKYVFREICMYIGRMSILYIRPDANSYGSKVSSYQANYFLANYQVKITAQYQNCSYNYFLKRVQHTHTRQPRKTQLLYRKRMKVHIVRSIPFFPISLGDK